jgi:hypothetical protein
MFCLKLSSVVTHKLHHHLTQDNSVAVYHMGTQIWYKIETLAPKTTNVFHEKSQ